MSDETLMTEAEFTERVLAVLEPFSPKNPELLARHAWLVREKNEVMNLTRITEPEDMARRHILDSLAASPLLEETDDLRMRRIVDLGSGGGYPGLALAIALPHLEVTLIDSTKKKVAFLQEIVNTLGLSGRVRCLWGRFEDLMRTERHRTDLVVARAVGPLKDILGWCTNRWFGHILLWKGPKFDDELAESETLMRQRRIEVVMDEQYQIPGDDVLRRLIMIGTL